MMKGFLVSDSEVAECFSHFPLWV